MHSNEVLHDFTYCHKLVLILLHNLIIRFDTRHFSLEREREREERERGRACKIEREGMSKRQGV